MKKIISILGTRPEAIKMSPLIKELRKKFKVKLCITAQHREMLDEVLDIFKIKPSYDLNIMKKNQDLFYLNSQIILNIKKILIKEKPSLVMVHGDTSTAFVSSLAAFYLNIPIAHVEAGLRTYNMRSPFPEEFNRQIIDKLSSVHFAPTKNAFENLLKEKINRKNIYITGNTGIDSLLTSVKKIKKNKYPKEIIKKLPFLLKKESVKIILVTCHRRENFDTGISNICKALLEIAKNNSMIKIVFSVHSNPNIRKPVKKILKDVKNIYLMKPIKYLNFVKLMHDSFIILTDSGGIQEEAPALGKPVIVMRETTERPESLYNKRKNLVGSQKNIIVKTINNLLMDKKLYKEMAKTIFPYGKGGASIKIRKVLEKKFL